MVPSGFSTLQLQGFPVPISTEDTKHSSQDILYYQATEHQIFYLDGTWGFTKAACFGFCSLSHVLTQPCEPWLCFTAMHKQGNISVNFNKETQAHLQSSVWLHVRTIILMIMCHPSATLHSSGGGGPATGD